jgi:hypothetical protein
VIQPVVTRLLDRYEDCIQPELRHPFALGLPPLTEIPGQINVGRIIQLRNLAKAYDMVDYGKFRYNLLGNAADWFPGHKASPEILDPVRADLEALLKGLPAGELLMPAIEEANELLYSEPEKRLSESG